jgi:hypothetical protein
LTPFIMLRLGAHFDVSLPGQCLVAWPDDQPLSFACTIGEFNVSIGLIAYDHWRMKRKDEHNWTLALRAARVRVSRDEIEHPPEAHPDDKGTMDYTIQFEYFERREKEFGAAAQEAVNRVIRFFRFPLRTPYLEDIPVSHQCFRNARWTDEHDREVGKGGMGFVAERTPGLHGELGVRRLTPDLSESLQRFLERPPVLSLFEELLSDAQTAWFAGNLRRCVLELAVACEILVKRRFFAQDSPAGAAFDYLEDKGQMRIRVVDLLDRVSREAFGNSFRSDYPDRYRDIDHLFRCRNKVAHRGELSYRDDGGNRVRVDAATVERWWASILALVEWLASERHEPGGV